MGSDLQRPDDRRGGDRSGRASRRRTRVPGPERSGGSCRGTCTCSAEQAQLLASGGRMIQMQPAELTRGTDVTGKKRKARKISDPELLAPLASDCVMVDQ